MLIDNDFQNWYNKMRKSEKPTTRDWENEDEFSRSFDQWENEGGTIHPQATLSKKVKEKNLCKLIRDFIKRK